MYLVVINVVSDAVVVDGNDFSVVAHVVGVDML